MVRGREPRHKDAAAAPGCGSPVGGVAAPAGGERRLRGRMRREQGRHREGRGARGGWVRVEGGKEGGRAREGGPESRDVARRRGREGYRLSRGWAARNPFICPGIEVDRRQPRAGGGGRRRAGGQARAKGVQGVQGVQDVQGVLVDVARLSPCGGFPGAAVCGLGSPQVWRGPAASTGCAPRLGSAPAPRPSAAGAVEPQRGSAGGDHVSACTPRPCAAAAALASAVRSRHGVPPPPPPRPWASGSHDGAGSIRPCAHRAT